MENRFKTPFEQDLAEGLAYLKKSLSTLIQYTISMGVTLKNDRSALEFFQELEVQLYQLREKVDGLSLNLNIKLRKSTPFITEVLVKEIKNLSKLHHKAAENPKNEYTATIKNLENELQNIVVELKRFNQY